MRVLYVSYWGALEQLGQSLILPAIRELSAMGAELTLVTFEKPSDLEREEEMRRVHRELDGSKIRWIPLRYHKTPKIPATLFDIASGVAAGLRARIKERFDIVHARTYVGGLMGLPLSKMLGAKFVYHNEGFYPDEQVDCGVWAENSRPHRVARRLEHGMYESADGIIVLSERSKRIVEQMPHVARKKTPVILVPSCVDLERFRLPEKVKPERDRFDFAYVGSVGGRYILREIGDFVAAVRATGEPAHLNVYSRADRKLVKSLLAESRLAEDGWTLRALANDEVPAALAQNDAGVHFLRAGISEHTGSPTKIGEYWATGLPVVITPKMSDNDLVARDERTGVVIENHSEAAYLKAFGELKLLRADAETPARCRRAAENHYALRPACERQFALYEKLTAA